MIGEALVDIVATPDRVRGYPGGSPTNVAVGLARLGIEVELLTRLGADANGDLIERYLTDNGVGLLQPRDNQPTSVAEVTIGSDGTAAYAFDVAWTLDRVTARAWASITRAACVHIGSVAAILAPGAAAVRAIIQSVGADHTVSYDPNCRPQLMGDAAPTREQVEALVRRSDIVKVSTDDLAWLYPGAHPNEVGAGWLSLGPKIVIVTDGANGAGAITADATVGIQAAAVKVIDTVGAGD